ncbi:MAG: hypothetical protein KME59_19430 [Trichormus sp. ATA11-4-KO1]|jgi:hypothetical protein|nr:hypothetical protein [Trichormus sp. ATA11-4-KO1]
MEQGKSSTLEKIKQVNPGGISDNMMVARLSRILNETKNAEKEKDNLTVDSPERQQQPQQELGKLLSQGQNTDEYKQQLKQQYLSQYLAKFGLEEQKPQPQPSAVITQLEKLSERQKSRQQSVPQKQSISSIVKDKFSKAVESVMGQNERTNKDQEKKPFIIAVMDAIITRGKNIGNGINTYENEGYKAQLQVQNTKQILSIDRKKLQPQQQNPAFQAEKEGANDFKILRDDLSQAEVKNIVELNQQEPPSQSPQTRIQQKRKEKDKGLDIGD